MMKLKLMALLGFIFLTQLSFGQQDEESLSVYFAPGRAKLNDEAKAALKTFAEKAKQYSDYELELRAFTDDVGSIEYNKKLSERRAKAVEGYLKDLNIKPTEKIVASLGEVALLDETNVEAQRRENRRVDLRIKPFAPKSFNEFFSYLSDNDVQEFVANNEEESSIYGNKGTVVNIPAQAFVNQKGEVITSVNIELKEAYSYGDMLKHNLGTTSDNKILQTGGMIYIEVSDANTGEVLSLREGQELEINMPSQQALPEGMQLFVADRNAAAEETNWKPIPRPFTSRKVERINRPSSISKYTYQNRKPLSELEFDTDLTIFDLERAPDYMPKPTCPKMPQYPKLQETELLTLEQLKNKYQRRRGESKRKYAERLDNLLVFETKVVETAKIKNQRKIEAFQRDSVRFLKQLAQYRLDSLKYEQYLADIESIVDYLEVNADEIEILVHKLRRQHLALEFRIDLDDFTKAVTISTHYYDKLFAEAERMGLSQTMAYLEENALLLKDSTQKVIRNERFLAEPLKANYSFWGKIGMNMGRNDNDFIDMEEIRLKKDIKEYSENALDELAVKLQDIYDKLDKIKANSKSMNENLEKFLKIAQVLQSEKIGEFAETVNQTLSTAYNTFIEERLSKGLASDYEKQQYFVNTVRTSNLGWINCDRFLQYEGEKMELLVKHEADENTRFFVVFKEMKSVLPLQMGSTGYSSKMYEGVPADADVKVIGMQIKDGLSATFEFDGKVRDVQNMKIEFKHRKLEEMREILDRV